jgi:hypothetical protein
MIVKYTSPLLDTILYTGDFRHDLNTQPTCETCRQFHPRHGFHHCCTASAAVQALSEALQPAVFQQHKLTLPLFWTEDPVGWFLHAEVKFALVRMPANSYVCYMHVVRALPSEVLTAVRDLTRDVTAAMPKPYLLIKDDIYITKTTCTCTCRLCNVDVIFVQRFLYFV